jgi:hypothetical protein
MPFRFNGASKSILNEYLLELVRYIEDGFNMGRREDLTGGGLRRSAGGWKGVLEGIGPVFRYIPAFSLVGHQARQKKLQKRMMLNY